MVGVEDIRTPEIVARAAIRPKTIYVQMLQRQTYIILTVHHTIYLNLVRFLKHMRRRDNGSCTRQGGLHNNLGTSSEDRKNDYHG